MDSILMNKEHQWREIPNFPNYLISDHGEVISFKLKTPKLLKNMVLPSGVEKVRIREKKKEYNLRVDTLLSELFGIIPISELDNDLGEIWRRIEEFPDYCVSNFGNVMSYKRSKPKLLSPSFEKEYKLVKLSNNDKTKSFLVHRLAAQTFIENLDESKNIVDHIDSNRGNNHVDNLRWVTHSENILFSIKKDEHVGNRAVIQMDLDQAC